MPQSEISQLNDWKWELYFEGNRKKASIVLRVKERMMLRKKEWHEAHRRND